MFKSLTHFTFIFVYDMTKFYRIDKYQCSESWKENSGIDMLHNSEIIWEALKQASLYINKII